MLYQEIRTFKGAGEEISRVRCEYKYLLEKRTSESAKVSLGTIL